MPRERLREEVAALLQTHTAKPDGEWQCPLEPMTGSENPRWRRKDLCDLAKHQCKSGQQRHETPQAHVQLRNGETSMGVAGETGELEAPGLDLQRP